MGRGVSSGGGQSSLGYLFGNGEAPKPASNPPSNPASNPPSNPASNPAPLSEAPAVNNAPSPKPATAAAQPADATKQIPAGIQGNLANNYYRADGQNCGNFITV